MDSTKEFVIGSNRKRPEYRFKTMLCPSCTGPIPLYSEQSQLVVCHYCGSALNCTKDELEALGQKHAKGHFVFDLGMDGVFENIKYKVIARMCSKDQWGGRYRTYLLFHPFHGTRWLSEYQNSYSMSYDSRVRVRDFHGCGCDDPCHVDALRAEQPLCVRRQYRVLKERAFLFLPCR